MKFVNGRSIKCSCSQKVGHFRTEISHTRPEKRAVGAVSAKCMSENTARVSEFQVMCFQMHFCPIQDTCTYKSETQESEYENIRDEESNAEETQAQP